MDAIILVGGQGLRLRPLTANRHKSLVPVCNRPAIWYLFDWLRRSGIERVVLAIGRHNEDLAAAFPEGRDLGFSLRHIFEQTRLESGGAIRNAVEATGINDRFLVLNGDVFLDFDLQRAIDAHASSSAELTLALTPIEDPSQFGVAVVDDKQMVTGFVEKPPRGSAPGNLVNAGAWIFERGLVDEIPPGAVRVEETLFPSLVGQRRQVLGYVFEGPWADIGTCERYLDLNLALLDRAGTNAIAEDATVDAGAKVTRSAIGSGTCVEHGAAVDQSVAWECCTIGAGAHVSRSILADGVEIGAEAALEGAVLGTGASVGAGCTVPPNTVLQPGERYDGTHGRKPG
jgi:mannose-1-phosphate guanylyltransferase